MSKPSSNIPQFTMHPGQWYTWQMLPGYLGGFSPYDSPIYVVGVHPLKTGKRSLKLRFLNAYYASGVQGFELTLRILFRGEHYLIADLNYDRRCAVIGELSDAWMSQHAREIREAYPGLSAAESLSRRYRTDNLPLD